LPILSMATITTVLEDKITPFLRVLSKKHWDIKNVDSTNFKKPNDF